MSGPERRLKKIREQRNVAVKALRWIVNTSSGDATKTDQEKALRWGAYIIATIDEEEELNA